MGIDASTWPNERGFGRFTRELVRALLRRDSGFEYTLCLDRSTPADLPEGARTCVASTRAGVTESAVGSGRRSLGDVRRMAKLLHRERFDLVFFPAVYSYVPVRTTAPIVVALHDTIAERYPRLTFPTWRNRLLWNLKTKFAVRRATRIMTVSEASARDLHELLRIPREYIDVVTEGAAACFRPLDADELPPDLLTRFDLAPTARLLVYAGGLNPHKNVRVLLEALPEVADRTPGLHLVLVGDTSGRGFFDNVPELQALVAESDLLRERVRFTGYVEDEVLAALLNRAEALVLPSLHEGFGLPALEALCCGTPVLASRRASLPEVVGEAGLYFDPLDASDVAATLERFLGDEALRRRLRARTLEQAARFGWDKGAALAEDCFERALAARSPAD